MHPPRFLWKEEGDTYDVEKEKDVIRGHYNKAVGVLNEGVGYDTLRGMKEHLEAHHNRAKEAASRYESRRNYARLQFGLMKQKVISIARERVEEEDDEAVEEEATQVLDEPMGAHAEALIGDGIGAVWAITWSAYEDKENTLSDISIHFRPENNTHYKNQVDEEDLRRTDQRLFDGDETWRDALESIQRRWEHVEEQHERAVKTKELLRFRAAVVKTVLYRFEAYGSAQEMTEAEAQEITEESKPGRPRRIENPEEVVETLNVVCEWLDTNPQEVFRGEGGLVNFASEKFPFRAKSTVRDRIRSTFRQLAKEYPDLPTPDLTTGTNGREYVESASEIRELRDEYKARFIEK
jgi:hypothetical protein